MPIGFAVLFATALAAPAGAQARFATDATDVARAEALEAKAEALYQSPGKYKQAARLHEQAAGLRPAGDEKRWTGLRQAARLYYYAGSASQSRAAMVRAADEAMAAGDVITAASTYLDAAFLFRETGRGAEAAELVRKAQLLSNSPLLSRQDRNAILSRIQAAA